VAQDPQVRQLVLALKLIPQGLANVQNPTQWERACAAGQYDGHATALGRSLVAAGLQNSVLRLGDEMNGNWEPDFIGTTVTEQKLWAKCFDNEVTGLRRAKGQNFLIDWNPNACADRYMYPNYYPGNAYVNIVGLDLYDVGCLEPYTRLTFSQLSNESLGLTYFEAFAAAKHKPMSFPEWGLAALPSADDPGYITGMAKTFESKDFAFEAYFDQTGAGINSLPLGPTTPLSDAAFHQGFASS
jgi:beta-mannanase